jgi:uncharacterized protein YndB with AHSA1/START domain
VADIVHRIGIRAPAAQVYQAIASRKGLARWWTNDVSGDEGLQGKLGFRFFTKAGALVGEMLMQVTALNRDSSVRWRCLEGPPEWVGTDLSFELTEADGMTIVLFAHRHWRETVEFTHHCSTKWAVFILSLRESVESGKGRPSPDDVKIDNWN